MSDVPTDYNAKPWIKMAVDDLTTPKPGRLIHSPAWWALTDDRCVLFYKSYSSPQCNTSRQIVERVRPGCDMMFIAVSYIPHNCSEYC